MRPSFLDDMSWAMAEVYGSVTDRILVNLAHYFPFVHDSDEVKGSFEYQARMLAQMGQVNKESADIIAKSLEGADEALRQSLELAIKDALKNEEPKLRKAAEKGLLNGAGFLPPEVAPNQMQAFQTYYKQSADHLNLVNTVMLESTQSAYQATVSDIVQRIQRTQSALNVGAGEVVTGVSSWNQAVRSSVQKMVKNGLTGFIDHGGHRWSPETYVAMDIRTTMFNTAREAIWERADDYGSDLYQVSSHAGARPLCYPWQGKVISRTDDARTVQDLDGNMVQVYAQSSTTYGQAAGLFGINCRHYPMTFVPGISTLRGEPQDPAENEKTYEESQQQRALERKLREERRDLSILKAQGAPDDEIKAQKAKVDQASADIDMFCEETGRTRRRTREYTPVNATFPDSDSYNPADFPTEQKDRMTQFFSGRADNNVPRTVTEEKFVPAKTTNEAVIQAANMGLTADYSKYHVSVSNAVNETAYRIQQEFGNDSLSAIKNIGTFPKGFSTNWKGVYSPTEKSLWLRNVNSQNALEKMGDLAKQQYKQGWWSTGSPLHVIRHEMGHAVADSLSEKIDIAKINEYRQSIRQQIIKSRGKKHSADFLSEYGLNNTNEFIAESFAEYLDGNPRETAKTVIEMIKGMIK